jgi:3'-5' exonuclease
MNINLKKIPIEKVLFFDIESVRQTKDLDPESKEFQLYRKKIRDKVTDELPSVEDTIADYNKRAALRIGYIKVIAISIAFVRAGEVYVKALVGEEEDILKEFFDITAKFDYISGVNILGYDLPVCYLNAAKYFDYTDIVPDRFVTSGKKPWELKSVIDLMDILRGTHYANMSLDEMLYHFGLDSSKTDIDGSQVSEVYYSEGMDRITEYAKKDVFANVNLFQAMQFKAPFKSYIDRNETSSSEPMVQEDSALQKLYQTDYLSDSIKESLKKIFGKKRLTQKDKDFVQDILENIYIRTTFMASDSEDIKQSKKAEIQEFLKTI